MISLLALPFFACVILVFIHVYFGAFVLRRGILFIDLISSFRRKVLQRKLRKIRRISRQFQN